MLLIAGVGVLLVVLTVVTHYETLRLLSAGLPRLRMPARTRLLVVIFAVFCAHLVEIAYHAVAFYWLSNEISFGGLGGRFSEDWRNYLYFSMVTYTSLGLGDVYPVGDLRLVAGLESLTGLLMIGWSASFTYFAMERFWRGDVERNERPARHD